MGISSIPFLDSKAAPSISQTGKRGAGVRSGLSQALTRSGRRPGPGKGLIQPHGLPAAPGPSQAHIFPPREPTDSGHTWVPALAGGRHVTPSPQGPREARSQQQTSVLWSPRALTCGREKRKFCDCGRGCQNRPQPDITCWAQTAGPLMRAGYPGVGRGHRVRCALAGLCPALYQGTCFSCSWHPGMPVTWDKRPPTAVTPQGLHKCCSPFLEGCSLCFTSYFPVAWLLLY